MSSFKRTDRIAELIQRQISHLIQHELKDPRLPPFVTISGVSVAPNLSNARIYFTVFEGDVDLTTKVLNTAAPFLRTALGKSLKLRIVPQLGFVHDASVDYGRRLAKLIDKVNPSDCDDERQE